MIAREMEGAKARQKRSKIWGNLDTAEILGIVAILILLILCMNGIASAEEAAHEGGGFVKEWLWKIVNFAILVAVLVYFAKKPLRNYLQARTEAIKKSLEDAKQAREMAEQGLREVEERLKYKDKELEEIVAGAKTTGEAERENLLKEAQKMSERILAQSKSNIDYELKKAKDAIKEEAVELAMELAERRLKEKLTPAHQKKLIEESIAKLERQS
jgi:F-type H+-transporting ATPase subunit b